ncbi:MAG: hypothetical protein HRU20_10150 [Pseudomonadales bacterium]|nr:hypothetical protein [Pseudomonadales bacterium]
MSHSLLGRWSSLFLYAITSYQVLDTGTEALILYAAVQISMMTAGMSMGGEITRVGMGRAGHH